MAITAFIFFLHACLSEREPAPPNELRSGHCASWAVSSEIMSLDLIEARVMKRFFFSPSASCFDRSLPRSNEGGTLCPKAPGARGFQDGGGCCVDVPGRPASGWIESRVSPPSASSPAPAALCLRHSAHWPPLSPYSAGQTSVSPRLWISGRQRPHLFSRLLQHLVHKNALDCRKKQVNGGRCYRPGLLLVTGLLPLLLSV